jgi:transcriptional regulator with XRE-family HTH domain
MKTFGAMLKERRTQLDLSSPVVAKALGCSVAYYLDVEHGSRPPFPIGSIYQKLADTLCLSKIDLLAAGHRGRVHECPDNVAELVAILMALGDTLTSEEIKGVEAIVNLARVRVEESDVFGDTTGGDGVRS